MKSSYSYRVEKEVHDEAARIFESIGMNLNSGISLTLNLIAASGKVPFSLDLDASKSIGSDKIYTVEEIRDKIQPVVKKHGLKRVWLFGSYARGEANTESDIDLLVDAPDLGGLFAVNRLAIDFEEVLKKTVDVVVDDSIFEEGDLSSELLDARRKSFQENLKQDRRLLYELQ